ncbi:UNKNOWN [Stylonychia lemnae]|uniref:Uncharacterized protein n=1 Tax=Stylonychia lemnae TaxID=5949 RepID=A0A078API0_STYLE|nr:UNKNOWN [Stylonychia lemnae]|eukprot:CDW83217.1 UNKNOWN [Stylonychia lemnae]
MKKIVKTAVSNAPRKTLQFQEAVDKPHIHEPLKSTFHVAMLLLGCGVHYENPKNVQVVIPSSKQDQNENSEQINAETKANNSPQKPPKQKLEIGTNILEATALRTILSQQKIQTKYFSLNGSLPMAHLAKINQPDQRDLMEESARLVRNTRDLRSLASLTKIDSFRALIIPSFTHEYNKYLLEQVYNVPLIRSIIKEFHMQQRYILAVGPTSIQLINKTLDLSQNKLKIHPDIKQKNPFDLKYNEENKIIYLPYYPQSVDDHVDGAYKLYEGIFSSVTSLKYRVLKERAQEHEREQQLKLESGQAKAVLPAGKPKMEEIEDNKEEILQLEQK